MSDLAHMESGFRVTNIILIDSFFSRINTVDFKNPGKTTFNIQTDVAVNGSNVNVSEEVDLIQEIDDKEQFKFRVKMVGLFERIGSSEIDLETFGKINGAAIIFPYIREHITAISLKAGLGPLILPPVNFAKQNENK